MVIGKDRATQNQIPRIRKRFGPSLSPLLHIENKQQDAAKLAQTTTPTSMGAMRSQSLLPSSPPYPGLHLWLAAAGLSIAKRTKKTRAALVVDVLVGVNHPGNLAAVRARFAICNLRSYQKFAISIGSS